MNADGLKNGAMSFFTKQMFAVLNQNETFSY